MSIHKVGICYVCVSCARSRRKEVFIDTFFAVIVVGLVYRKVVNECQMT